MIELLSTDFFKIPFGAPQNATLNLVVISVFYSENTLHIILLHLFHVKTFYQFPWKQQPFWKIYMLGAKLDLVVIMTVKFHNNIPSHLWEIRWKKRKKPQRNRTITIVCGDIIIRRNAANTISLLKLRLGDLNMVTTNMSAIQNTFKHDISKHDN